VKTYDTAKKKKNIPFLTYLSKQVQQDNDVCMYVCIVWMDGLDWMYVLCGWMYVCMYACMYVCMYVSSNCKDSLMLRPNWTLMLSCMYEYE